ncbi:type I-E CRISPR-associated protein Cas7/Cse4/CasC [Salipiger sp. 1_MG-2023]|nr:type I-E CRISPR-associated protein Cas7/Cse4/CasC [Salipiger sp. 1_MG-2023]MDO6587481.1 type I-E CRISPR-associated protein Cas7/Cse4/CasC [Salipiger sp. 1_MG-2023]
MGRAFRNVRDRFVSQISGRRDLGVGSPALAGRCQGSRCCRDLGAGGDSECGGRSVWQGRPKQAMVGGAPRLRMSSQSIKRALRESSFFALDLKEHTGTRTKHLHGKLVAALTGNGVAEEDATKAADTVAGIFGKLETVKKGETSETRATTLAFISPAEWALAEDLAGKIVAGEKLPAEKDLKKLVLRRADGAIDIAMFGRMLAADADFNRDAAVQVAHAITTHSAQAEEDWFSAVDDLNKLEDTGAGHLGEIAFGSGIYYQYVCVDCDLLVENLGGDRALAAKGIEALTRAIAQTTPRGKQNSFAHHPMAYHIRAERGSRAPRDLSGAFFKPVEKKLQTLGVNDLETGSVVAMTQTAAHIDACYFEGVAEEFRTLDTLKGEGTLGEIVRFATEAVGAA